LPDFLFQRHVFDFLFNIHSKPPFKAPVNDRKKDNPKGSQRPAILFVSAVGQRQTENGSNKISTNRKNPSMNQTPTNAMSISRPAVEGLSGAFFAGKPSGQ
jgi:hypothetical protein